ncbi:MAG: hypothetical protein ACE5PM_08060 [Candidatus Hydrothermarchaeales archaeon]
MTKEGKGSSGDEAEYHRRLEDTISFFKEIGLYDFDPPYPEGGISGKLDRLRSEFKWLK